MYQLTATTPTQTLNITDACQSVEITTARFDAASKMTFETIEESGIALEPGSAVSFIDDGTPVFSGFVFTAKRDMGGNVSYTAYDQLYYLKAKASYTFTNMPLEAIIQRISADFSLTVGTLAATGYTFPCLVEEDTSCLDIIFKALSQTIVQTGRIFVFYDDFGKLTLKEVREMLVPQMIGDGSLVTDYSYTQDIANDTYNRVKLVRPNKETGRTDAFVYEDTSTQGKWGLLQYYEKVDENLNDAQIDAMCQAYLKYYNRMVQSVSIDALGVTGLRAGNIIPVRISEVDTLSVNRLLLAERVTHSYQGEAHDMSIEVKNFDQIGGVTWI
jgi:hypothetical protein